MRYFIGFLITIGLIILLIVLLFGGGGNNVPKTPAHQPLVSYANTDAETRLTIDGPINAQQSHDQVQITVGRGQITYDQIKGYDGHVVNQQTYSNTENAYNNFLHALVVAGFTHGNTSTTLKDELGYCPLGNRYIFELFEGSNYIERYWSTNCGNPKTYLGSTPLTLTLFQNQVPNYADLVQNLSLQ